MIFNPVPDTGLDWENDEWVEDWTKMEDKRQEELLKQYVERVNGKFFPHSLKPKSGEDMTEIERYEATRLAMWTRLSLSAGGGGLGGRLA